MKIERQKAGEYLPMKNRFLSVEFPNTCRARYFAIEPASDLLIQPFSVIAGAQTLNGVAVSRSS